MKIAHQDIIRQIGRKLLGLMVLLAALSVLYRFTFYPTDVKKHCALMDLSKQVIPNTSQIVYLTDESNYSTVKQDADKRSICEMMAVYFPMIKMVDMSYPSSHAGVYYDMLNNIGRNSRVKAVVITVNMRTFGAESFYAPAEAELQKQQLMMKKQPALYKRFLLAFKPDFNFSDSDRIKKMDTKLAKQEVRFPYYFPYSNALSWSEAMEPQQYLYNGQKVPRDSIRLSCRYIRNFAYVLDKHNPRVKELDKIVSLCKHRGWKLIFNVVPENTEQLRCLAGPDLENLLRRNVAFITDRYTQRGVTVVNTVDAVFDRDFANRQHVGEQYNQIGRKCVAKNVAAALGLYYPYDYHPNGSMNNTQQ